MTGQLEKRGFISKNQTQQLVRGIFHLHQTIVTREYFDREVFENVGYLLPGLAFDMPASNKTLFNCTDL